MKYDDKLTPQQLWFIFAKGLIEQHGALIAAGMLAGILAKHTYANYDLKRDLKSLIEKL